MQKSRTLIVLISLDGYIIESYACSINPGEDMGGDQDLARLCGLVDERHDLERVRGNLGCP